MEPGIHFKIKRMKAKQLFFGLAALSVLLTTELCAQIPNSGFESWTVDVDGNNNPNGWETLNDAPSGILSTVQYTPAFLGNYAMQVKTFNMGFGPDIGGYAMLEFPCTSKPSFLSVCLKTNVMPGDKVYLIFSMWKGDSIVASPTNCTFTIDSTIVNWKCLNMPITYLSPLAPDSANIMVIAGSGTAQLGTYIIVDDLKFSTSVELQENELNSGHQSVGVFPNPVQDETHFSIDLSSPATLQLSVMDVQGNVVKEVVYQDLKSGKQNLLLDLREISNGLYFYSIKGTQQVLNGKCIISH
jgi:hypothetical protein